MFAAVVYLKSCPGHNEIGRYRFQGNGLDGMHAAIHAVVDMAVKIVHVYDHMRVNIFKKSPLACVW
jgi:hypothetical protein